MNNRSLTRAFTSLGIVMMVSLVFMFSAKANVSSMMESRTDDVAVLGKIQGKVFFQKRNTIVPMNENDGISDVDGATSALVVCTDGASCPKSKNYWSLIVVAGDTHYEINRPFAVGQTRAPEQVNLAGVVVRPGSHIAIVGSVETLSPTYGVIFDVTNVTVVMDPTSPILDRIDSSRSILGWGSSSWNCLSTSSSGDFTFNAYVWFGKDSPTDAEGYHLRVLARQTSGGEKHAVNVANLGNVQMQTGPAGVIFQGIKDTTAAALMIRNDIGRIQSFPSLLTVQRVESLLSPVGQETSKIPMYSQVRMSCSPVQYSGN